MKTQHTQGEWSNGEPYGPAHAQKGQTVCNVTSDKSTLIVAKVIGRNEKQCKANAKLIATAPELLGELERLVSKHQNHLITNEDIEQTIKVIEKATE